MNGITKTKNNGIDILGCNWKLQEKYIFFNNKYFDGELPSYKKVEIIWNNRLRAGAGKYIYDPRKNIKHKIELGIAYHKKYPEMIEDTLLHEMVHLWQKDVRKQKASHNYSFLAKSTDIKRKSNDRFNIKVTAKDRGVNRWEYHCLNPNCSVIITRTKRLPVSRSFICGKCKTDLLERKGKDHPDLK